MLYIGIDPGLSGGLAALTAEGELVWAVPMMRTPYDLLQFLKRINEERLARAMVEHAHSFPRQGHVGAFTFGKNIGHLEMALLAAGIPANTVSPKAWQLELQCLTGGNKNISKRRAQELFPSALPTGPASITHSIADALLLAEYGRRLWLGLLRRPDGKAEAARPDQTQAEEAERDPTCGTQAANPGGPHRESALARQVPGAARSAATRHGRARARP